MLVLHLLIHVHGGGIETSGEYFHPSHFFWRSEVLTFLECTHDHSPSLRDLGFLILKEMWWVKLLRGQHLLLCFSDIPKSLEIYNGIYILVIYIYIYMYLRLFFWFIIDISIPHCHVNREKYTTYVCKLKDLSSRLDWDITRTKKPLIVKGAVKSCYTISCIIMNETAAIVGVSVVSGVLHCGA